MANIGDIIQLLVTIKQIPMNLPCKIVGESGNNWIVEVQYSDGEISKPRIEVPKP